MRAAFPPVTRIAPRLDAPDDTTLTRIAGLPRDGVAHDACLSTIPAMTMVEAAGTAGDAPLDFPLTVAAWNLERCLFPPESAAKLAATGAAVVLLSEMDDGMARTGQRHPTAEIAATLGMAYLYGVEFIELGLGSETERDFCLDNHNARGLHGNAALSRNGFAQPFMLRLPGMRRWFTEADDQPRLGERMAIGGLVETTSGPIAMVSTHLESNADAPLRHAQISAILDYLEAAFPGIPALIGGDLNSGNHIGGDWRDESLFDAARARGYQIHGGPEDQVTTRPSLITRWPGRAMKLDWFVTRGLTIRHSAILPSTEDSGRPLSDHDLITLEISGLSF